MANNPIPKVADIASVTVSTGSSPAVVGTRKQINFISGAGVSLTIVDNPLNNRVDVTVAAGDINDGSIN